MESQRNILIIALLLVSFLIWQQWDSDKNPLETAQQSTQTVTATGENEAGNFVPESDQVQVGNDIPTEAVASNHKHQLITISSDLLEITIDSQGGDIVNAALLEHD